MIIKGLEDSPEVKSTCCSCKGQGSVPSSFVVTHDHLKLQLQGIQCSLPTHAWVYLHTCKQTLKDKLIIKIFINYSFKTQGKKHWVARQVSQWASTEDSWACFMGFRSKRGPGSKERWMISEGQYQRASSFYPQTHTKVINWELCLRLTFFITAKTAAWSIVGS